MVVANSGDITLGGAYTGILLNKWGAGVMSLDNSGDIAAVAGQMARTPADAPATRQAWRKPHSAHASDKRV